MMGIFWSKNKAQDLEAVVRDTVQTAIKEFNYAEHERRNFYSGAFTLPALGVQWTDILSYSDRANAIYKNAIAKTCVQIRAKAISNIDIAYEGSNPSIKLLLESPNHRDGTFQTFLNNGEVSLSIGGDLYLFWDLRVRSRPMVHAFRQDLVVNNVKEKRFEYNPTGTKPEYIFEYDDLGRTVRALQRNGHDYKVIQGGLQQISYFDPRTATEGAGAGDSALRAIDIINHIDGLLANKFKAGGSKNGFFQVQGFMTDDEKARLKADLEMLNPDGTQVLPANITFNSAQLTLAEMEVLEAYDKMATLICTAFQVPAELVFENGATYANARGMDKIFYRNFIGPEAHWLVGQLQAGLRLYIDPKATISVDETSVQHLEEDRIERASKMAMMKSFTVNEVRASMGYDPLKPDDGGDEIVGASVNMGQPEEKPKGEVAFNANAGNRGDKNND